MDIAAGIAATTQALGIAKALRGIERSYDEATLKSQLADLTSVLADAKLALTEAKETLGLRDREIANLKANFSAQGNLVVSDGDYKFFQGENEKPLGYPICPKCEIDGKIIQMKQNGGIIQARCPGCLTEYQPVTCFLPPEAGDDTSYARQKRLRNEQSARATASMRRINSRSGW